MGKGKEKGKGCAGVEHIVSEVKVSAMKSRIMGKV